MSDANAGSTPRQRIGRYELVRELGRGGMAVVYLARQPALDRLVALKQLAAFGTQDQQLVHRFLREAQIAGSLNDPNIVTVYESFLDDAMPHISMEYLAPGAMRPLVGKLRLDQSIAVMHDVLAGLSAAEKRGIVHRDLKPENLLVTDDGRVKIADFGIAKAVDRVATVEFRTAQGMTVGTPTYMAPEQAMGTELTPATDLYSLGVIAYELMVGKLPFDSDSPVALLLHHVSDPPPPPLSVNPSLDPDVGAWIERLLVKEPADRTPSAQQAWDELEDIAIHTLGPRWRRNAALPDPRTGIAPTPLPPSRSGYVTVDPDRFAPGSPPDGYVTAPAPEPPHPATSPPSAPTAPVPASDSPDPFRAPPRAVPAPAPVPTPPPPPVPVAEPATTVFEQQPDLTAPPQRPLPTPAPVPVEPPTHRGGIRWFVWLPILLLLAGGAAAAAFLARPQPVGTATATPTATTAPDEPPSRFESDAFTLELPAGWSDTCLDQQGTCAGNPVPEGTWRSALSAGSGASKETLAIDRIPLTGSRRSVTTKGIVDQFEQLLSRALTGYRRSSGDVRTVTIGDGRKCYAFAFTSDVRSSEFGSVFVFKEGHDAYVVTGTGPDAQTALRVAQGASESLQPK